jgi:hypothetical protein
MTRRHPTDFNGMVYIGLMGGAPFLEKADKLVTFSPEFMKAVHGRDFFKIIPMPDGTEVLRITAINRTVWYQIVRNRTTGHIYGELMEERFFPSNN